MDIIRHETLLKGVPISEGVVFGEICLINQNRHINLSPSLMEPAQKETEKKRFYGALRTSTFQLEQIIRDVESRIGRTEAQIFVAQKMILEDGVIHEEILRAVYEDGVNAEGAIIQIFDKYENRLQNLEDDYIKNRATDIGEIKTRLLNALLNQSSFFRCAGDCQKGRDRLVVAYELTPGLTVEMDTHHTLGFVTEKGGRVSHAAILAKALGVPAVSGIQGISTRVLCGTEMIIDGTEGLVILWPSEETKAIYSSRIAASSRIREVCGPVKGLKVMANINLAAHMEEAVSARAEGIGLYRTEFEFLSRNRILTEEEQYQLYASVLEKSGGFPVYLRLLDFGGDKNASFLELEKEENPALGFRGSRFLLARKDLLALQIRAVARASRIAPVHLLYPMVVDSDQYLRLKEIIIRILKEAGGGTVYHGVMFEVPAACFQAESLLENADFASIGSNDLIQYLFALDRNNEMVSGDYNPDHPVFWNLLRIIAGAADKLRKPLSLCGEVAGNSRYTEKILEMGISTVSVSPRLIPKIRKNWNETRISY